MTKPPKNKRFLCVCPDGGLFLMINSQDRWGPSVKLAAGDAGNALDHDSYAALSQIIPRPDIAARIESAEAEMLGEINRWGLRGVLNAVEMADALAPSEIELLATAIALRLAEPQ